MLLEAVLNVERLVTLHYIEQEKDFSAEDEIHDYWEFVYIERGTVDITSENNKYTLKEGEIIFHRPNERHNMRAGGADTKVIVTAFVCRDKAMDFFACKALCLNTSQKSLLSLVLKETAEIFCKPLSIPYQAKMARKKNNAFASGQMIKTYLEQFLISLIRSDTSNSRNTGVCEKNENEDRIIEAIVHYLKSNITKQLTLDVICKDICFSKSYIKQLFSRKKGEGIVQYFTSLKIDQSKRLIAEDYLNITQISEMLGFSSIHYFSRVFKNKTGMSPREYSKMVNNINLI